MDVAENMIFFVEVRSKTIDPWPHTRRQKYVISWINSTFCATQWDSSVTLLFLLNLSLKLSALTIIKLDSGLRSCIGTKMFPIIMLN